MEDPLGVCPEWSSGYTMDLVGVRVGVTRSDPSPPGPDLVTTPALPPGGGRLMSRVGPRALRTGTVQAGSPSTTRANPLRCPQIPADSWCAPSPPGDADRRPLGHVRRTGTRSP